MQKDVRNKFFWERGETEYDSPDEEQEYEPKFYLKSKWQPPKLIRQEKIIEDKMLEFKATTLRQME